VLGNDASRKPPVEYWTRPCLKCGRAVRIPRSRRTCQKCFLRNMEARAGVYGSYVFLGRRSQCRVGCLLPPVFSKHPLHNSSNSPDRRKWLAALSFDRKLGCRAALEPPAAKPSRLTDIRGDFSDGTHS
jgi:hypothetical protein